jgi:hypothetical protein
MGSAAYILSKGDAKDKIRIAWRVKKARARNTRRT